MTSTLRDPLSDPPLQKPAASGEDPGIPKRRPSCTACFTHPARYPARSQQASPAASRRNSQQRINNNNNQNAIVPSTGTSNPHRGLALTPSSRSSSQDSLTNPNPNPSAHTFIDLASPSSSFQGPGFTLNFNTHHSHPKIKCHIDHLHQDLDLDVKLNDTNNRHHHHNNNNNNNDDDDDDKALGDHASGTTKLTLDCYNCSHPNKNIKLRVELVKTSPKGFGLRVMQYMPKESISDAPTETKKENSRKEKIDSDSRRSSIRSESSKNVPKIHDISDLDEVRISGGSKGARDDSEDTCKCTTPCGVPGCKAEEGYKHTEGTL
ncbi:hypothetical protein GOP47_0016135 [Adiantum capillus-veneris]|uniref:Uncharacterized protein n=1 Tax=Adiantum capillus-veneris TaxID=13818 RepID=A0A9D4ZC86_ADICA|nr:hypothetical protein GOP47_0016135 [Adiantum capillus-veneris]